MLSNGVNIVYLKQLTGLDINTLLADYDLEEIFDSCILCTQGCLCACYSVEPDKTFS